MDLKACFGRLCYSCSRNMLVCQIQLSSFLDQALAFAVVFYWEIENVPSLNTQASTR